MRYTPYALPSIISAVVMFLLFIYVILYRRRSTGAWQFIGIMLVCIVWASCYAMTLLNVDLKVKVFWFNLAQIGPDFGPIFWLLLTFEYIGRSDLLRKKWIAALFALPLFTTFLMWTNDHHHLLRGEITLSPLNDGVTYLSIQRGPWFYIETVYGYLIIAATLFFLIRFIKFSSSKKQTMVLIFAFTVPLLANFLDILSINPLKPFGSTSIIFSLTGLVLTWGLFSQRLLDITPIALNKVLENIGDGVILLDDRNRIVNVNLAACKLFNLDFNQPASFTGRYICELLPEWPARQTKMADKADDIFQLTLRIEERRRFFDVTVSTLYNDSKAFVGSVSIFHDMTEEKEINERLQFQLTEIKNLQVQLRDQALRDPLTSCFNRRYLEEMLSRESLQADRDQDLIGLVMLDIDHFKLVNDTYGHVAGDKVLQAVSQCLQQRVRLGDMVCRYGGEEFMIVFPGISLQAITERAHFLCNQIADLQVPASNEAVIKVTVSVGVALYPLHGEKLSEVFEHVDQALYMAKETGRNRVCVWEEQAETP